MHELRRITWELRETPRGLFIYEGSQCVCRVTARSDAQVQLLLAAPQLWNVLVRLSARYDLPDDVRLILLNVLQHVVTLRLP